MRTFIISEIEKISNQTDKKVSLLLPPAGISRSKWYEWKTRSGQETRHNANVPKNGWLLPWERDAIIDYCEANKNMFRGYRYLAWDLFEDMKEYNVELLITRAKELYPDDRPRIIYDNGKQYVGEDFKKLLALLEIADSRTRPFHPQSNGKVERFHRTLKTEHVRRTPYVSASYAEIKMAEWIAWYNSGRLNGAISYLTPDEVFDGKKEKRLAERKQKLYDASIRRQEYWRNQSQLQTS